MSDIQTLPVETLENTCSRFLKQVKPLLTAEAYRETLSATRYFKSAKGKGRQLHAALQEAAHSSETSWLAEAWLKSYLDSREPLPLVSNVGFKIQNRGKDLADWAAALSAVCADYHHNRIPVPTTPQGGQVCMNQWRILQGACRIPQQGSDFYRIAPRGASRHIGVFHCGYYYRILALDEQYEAFHAEAFRKAIALILQEEQNNPYPVAALSYLHGDEAAKRYAGLQQLPENQALAAYLEQDLFHISISSQEAGADAELAAATFQPQQNVWCYKPTTYCYNTATGSLHLHCEHSWEDGGTLKAIVAAAAEKTETPQGRRTKLEPIRYDWRLASEQQAGWSGGQADYRRLAESMKVRSLLVPFGAAGAPKGMSHDALMQFLLQYAQLSTYGKIRNTYEAVDVSHFRNGRTECVRPVSEESLAFVGGLLQHKPDRKALDAALQEHKNRIKACKLGLGANRQLLGLKLAAQANAKRMPVFFQSEGYRIFNTDFLSTSTIGDDSVVVNFAFAPTSAGGLGINYTLTPQGWLFTVSHHQKQQEVGIFLEALKQGGEELLAFVCAG